MQWSPSRHPNSLGGPTKAAAVREAAAALVEANIVSARDINTENAEKVKTVLRGVDGIGYATSNYFLMLLGAPGVKPDRMIHRFLRDATGKQLTNKYAEQVLTAAAEELRTEPHRLEHAIWFYESDKAQWRRATARLDRPSLATSERRPFPQGSDGWNL
jgi:thermostable 8-oxoguanine DNA glycosylase